MLNAMCCECASRKSTGRRSIMYKPGSIPISTKSEFQPSFSSPRGTPPRWSKATGLLSNRDAQQQVPARVNLSAAAGQSNVTKPVMTEEDKDMERWRNECQNLIQTTLSKSP
eukprot:747810-Hanusia_phi.AAC.1